MDFVALDVETANADLSSICQIGIVQFDAGAIFKHDSFLIDPQDEFDEINISIHGIESTDVEGSPTFAALFPTLAGLLSSQVVVHHTAFDRIAIARAMEKSSLPPLSCLWLDSARVARRMWEQYRQSGYGLANLAADFGIVFEHHDASEDARAAGEIMHRAIAESGVSAVDWVKRIQQKPSDHIARTGNPDGPMAGETVVFTGALEIVRTEAADLAAAAGCHVARSVTQKTTLVVIGNVDVRQLAGHDKSAKHRKAEKLIAAGAKLRIISEDDFRALVS